MVSVVLRLQHRIDRLGLEDVMRAGGVAGKHHRDKATPRR